MHFIKENILNVFKCFIISLVSLTLATNFNTNFNKTLTLAIEPFLFTDWRPLWICYGARCVHFTVPSGRKGAVFFLGAAHSAAHSSKRFKPLSTIILLCQCYCWIEKNTSNCVMVLIIRPGSTLKFQFVIGFNEWLWAIFFLLSFQNFWFYIYLGCVYMIFDFTTEVTLL